MSQPKIEQKVNVNNIESQDNINQYLTLNEDCNSQQNIILFNQTPDIDCQQEIDNNNLSSNMLSRKSIQQIQKKSIFHNFQKHLVITLRKIIQVKKDKSDSQIIYIAYKMWKVFVSSKNCNKSFLHILFGEYDEDHQINRQLYESYGYSNIITAYGVNKIRQAQQYLRFQALTQFHGINIQAYLSKRKMKNKQKFMQYLVNFFKTMSQGPIKRRFPKQKIKNISIQSKTQIYKQ